MHSHERVCATRADVERSAVTLVREPPEQRTGSTKMSNTRSPSVKVLFYVNLPESDRVILVTLVYATL